MLGPCSNRYLDANIAVEPVEDAHQPVHGEAVELDLADARKIGRRNTGAGLGIADGQFFLVERLDHFGGEDRAELTQARIGHVEIGKDIA